MVCCSAVLLLSPGRSQTQLVVLGLGQRDGGNVRRVSGSRGCQSSHHLVGAHPIVDSMVKNLLESTHVDGASWAGPESRLMVR